MHHIPALVRSLVATCTRLLTVRRKAASNQSGMTLVEILIVLTIVGLIMGLGGYAVLKSSAGAKVRIAKQQIQLLRGSYTTWKNLNSASCPESEYELTDTQLVPGAKDKKGNDAIPKTLLDPWGVRFYYKCPGEHGAEDIDVASAGPDKQFNTPDDIQSWNPESMQ